MPSLLAWIPYDWQIEAQEEAEKLRKEEEERKRREEEERRKREIKRTSDGKVIINLSNRVQSSDKAQSSNKPVVKVKKDPKEATSSSVNSINEEPKDTVVDTDTENEEINEVNEVNESKEYSFSELRSFLESF